MHFEFAQYLGLLSLVHFLELLVVLQQFQSILLLRLVYHLIIRTFEFHFARQNEIQNPFEFHFVLYEYNTNLVPRSAEKK